MYIYIKRSGSRTSQKRKSHKMNTLTQNSKYLRPNQELTMDKIMAFAIENDKSFEMFSPVFDRWGDEICEEKGLIGINLTKHVWFWFNLDRWGFLSFDHRYNCDNGARQFSSFQARKAESIILNK